MGIFRGEGGTGDSNTDATVTAVTEQATIATTKASEAAASAAEASTSAANSAASASSSSNSSAAAATSATQAATSATASAASATASASSATSAATAQANAETAETNAETAETNAAASATTATTKASEAATSATSASTSASTATTKASEAATSASNAATSETNAATSASTATTKASEASTSASNAATSEANAAASYDDFDDRYLGAKSSAPSTDNDGDALVTGALYFDTSSDSMKVYSGSAWLDAYASLSGALIATNNLSDLNNVGTARTNLGLGTAATTASTDYATAAQGTTADNALPKSGGAMTGAITTNSTFDGRDVSADGTKLDGIEAGATADQTASEIKTAYESNADTNAFTDADHTKLDGIEASADVTDTANVTAAGALMDSELTSEASVKALNQGVATTDSPTFAGLTVDTNTLYVDSTNNRVGVGTTSPNANLDIESSNATLHLTDSDDSTYAEVRNNGGTLTIGSDVGASAGGSSINFKVDNTERMRIDSSGNVGIGTTSPTEKLHLNGTALMFGARMSSNNGSTYWDVKRDISTGHFHIADDSLGNVLTIRQDSGNVGIGTSSPKTTLNVAANNSGQGSILTLENSDTSLTTNDVIGQIDFYANDSSTNGTGAKLNIKGIAASAAGTLTALTFGTSDSTSATAIERMRIDSSGNVGIGTTSPDYPLTIVSDDPDIRQEMPSSSSSSLIQHLFTVDGVQEAQVVYNKASGSEYFGLKTTKDIIFQTGGSAERMRIDSSGNTTFTGNVTIDQGTGGDAILTLRTDTDNNDEGDHPALRLQQDANAIAYRFGIGISDGDSSASNNDLCITAENNAASNLYMVTSSGTKHTFWHAGNDGSGSGLDADTVDSIQASSFLRSDANDTTTGGLTVDNYFLVANNGVTGQGDNNTHFNYQNNGVNYIRGTNTYVSSPYLTCNYLRPTRIYSASDGSSGHFYNDSGTRTAYSNGDFYIQSSVGNYYNYATNQYLGNTSGDIIHTRGNRVTGNNFEFATNGDFYVNAGFGSKGIAYACRAWGRYEMIGTHSWRDDEGFSTISDLGTGRSRIYFTNTMPNSYYSVQVTAGSTGYTTAVCAAQVHTTSTTNFYVDNEDLDSGFTDRDNMHIAVFR